MFPFHIFFYISKVLEIDVTQNHLFGEVILTHRATHSLMPTVHSKKLRQKTAKENFDLRTFMLVCGTAPVWFSGY